MRFLANENFPLASVRLLRQAGHQVFATTESASGAKDSTLLSRATVEKMILLTFDRDYGELVYHRKMPSPLGVIYFRFDPQKPEEPAEFIFRVLAIPNFIIENQFTVIEREKIRQRPLPSN